MVVGAVLDFGVMPGTGGFPDNQVKGLFLGVAVFAGCFEECGLKAFFQAPMVGVLLDFEDAGDCPLIIEGSRSDGVAGFSMMQDKKRRPDCDNGAESRM